MYTEQLNSCPNCLSTLNGNENKCPTCGIDLVSFKNANSANHLHNNTTQTQYSPHRDSYNNNAHYAQQQNNNAQNYNAHQQNMQMGNSNFYNNPNTNQLKTKKNTGIIVFLAIIFLIVAGYVIFNAMSLTQSSFGSESEINFDEFLEQGSDTNFAYDTPFPEGVHFTENTTVEEVESHYKSANVINMPAQSWVNTQQEFSRAPDKEGERQYYYISQDGTLAKAVSTNEAQVYFKYDDAAEVYSHDENSANVFMYIQEGEIEYDFYISMILLNYYEIKSVFEFIQQHAVLFDDYRYELVDIVDFGNGVKGYGVYEISDYRHSYIIYVPVQIENSEFIEVIEINVDCSYYGDIDGEFKSINDYDKLVEYMTEYLHVELSSAIADDENANANTAQSQTGDISQDQESTQQAQSTVSGERERIDG